MDGVAASKVIPTINILRMPSPNFLASGLADLQGVLRLSPPLPFISENAISFPQVA